jgi:hypothetical protein
MHLRRPAVSTWENRRRRSTFDASRQARLNHPIGPGRSDHGGVVNLAECRRDNAHKPPPSCVVRDSSPGGSLHRPRPCRFRPAHPVPWSLRTEAPRGIPTGARSEPAVHAGYTPHRRAGECHGHQRSLGVRRIPGQRPNVAVNRPYQRTRSGIRVSHPRPGSCCSS